MQITATIQVESQKKSGKNGWNGISKHVNRQLQQEKNITINKEYTSMNRLGTIANRQKTLNKVLMPYIKERDSAYSKNSKKRYNDVSGYLRASKVVPDKLYLATYGNKEAKEQAVDAIARARNISNEDARLQYLDACGRGLEKYADSFNRRHPNITVGHYGVHVDEGGAPHVHMQAFAHGTTAKGKPSLKFNEGVIAELSKDETVGKTADELRKLKTGELMSLFRSREDPELVRVVGDDISKEFADVPELQSISMARTGKTGHLTMDEYKDLKAHEEALTNTEVAKRDELRKEQEELEYKNAKLKEDNASLADASNATETRNRNQLVSDMYGLVQDVQGTGYKMIPSALTQPEFEPKTMIYNMNHNPHKSDKQKDADEALATDDAKDVHAIVHRNGFTDAIRRVQEWFTAKMKRESDKAKEEQAKAEQARKDAENDKNDLKTMAMNVSHALDLRGNVGKPEHEHLDDFEWYSKVYDGEIIKTKSGKKPSMGSLISLSINDATKHKLETWKDDMARIAKEHEEEEARKKHAQEIAQNEQATTNNTKTTHHHDKDADDGLDY